MCRLYTYFKYHTGKSRQAWKSHYIYHSYRTRHDWGIWSIACHVPVLKWNPFQVFFANLQNVFSFIYMQVVKTQWSCTKKVSFSSAHICYVQEFLSETLDLMKFAGSGGRFLTILCRINKLPCLINLSFQWVQRAEKQKGKLKIKKIKK